MDGIRKQLDDYRLYARAEIPVILFTVMLWNALQTVIVAAADAYAPALQNWQLAGVEILVASIGLWYVQRMKKGGRS